MEVYWKNCQGTYGFMKGTIVIKMFFFKFVFENCGHISNINCSNFENCSYEP